MFGGVRGAGKPRKENGPPCVFLMTNNFETGGSERQFVVVRNALRCECFQVRLGCLGRRGALQTGMDDIAEFNLGGSFFGVQAQRARVALARHLRVHSVAIAHSFDFYSNLTLIPTARWARVPVVIGSHRQIGDLLSPLQFGVQAIAFRLCDRVVCNSFAAARRLEDSGVREEKLVVIPNGIPDEAFAECVPALPPRPGVVRVGLIARMNSPVKNHSVFLRAAARLAPRFPSLEILLVGDGPLRPVLERMTKTLGLDDRVRFLGERQDIPAVLAAMDISVLPSLSESLSNAVLESMAAGKPVVAARVGGNPELILDGETGRLVSPDNEEKLAEALEPLLQQPSLRTEWGVRARNLARDRFSLSRMRERYQQLYLDLLAEKRWQPARVQEKTGGTVAQPVSLTV